MSTLHELQSAIGRSIRGGLEPAAVAAIAADGVDPAARLRIYRHHYEISLTEALKAIYPVVCRLVDERFFAFAARSYIEATPPRGVCLHEYGVDFPEFLAGFPPCRALAYLDDVARMEQLINQSLHSPVGQGLDAGAFAAVASEDCGALIFQLQPSLRYLDSPWPADRIWLANQPGQEGRVDLAEGGCRLEIRRQGEAVVFRRLDEPELALRRAIHLGGALEAAAADALAADPAFDLAQALRRLMAEGAIVDFRRIPS
jgi:hypothetical protein